MRQCGVKIARRNTRYRGIAKNGAQVFALLALANLYLARGRLVSA
jgi:IS5 family transposase